MARKEDFTMKKTSRLSLSLFGIIAVSAMIVCAFAACNDGGGGGGGSGKPVIPQKYKNTSWENTNGTTLTLGTDKITITFIDGTTGTYPYKDTNTIDGDTVLFFGNDTEGGAIAISNDTIIWVDIVVYIADHIANVPFDGWSKKNNEE
jgi:hypothetical protein